MEAHILGRVVTACAVTVGVGCFLLANVMFYEALMATLSQWADAQSLRVWNSSLTTDRKTILSGIAPQKLDTLL